MVLAHPISRFQIFVPTVGLSPFYFRSFQTLSRILLTQYAFISIWMYKIEASKKLYKAYVRNVQPIRCASVYDVFQKMQDPIQTRREQVLRSSNEMPVRLSLLR